MEKMTLPEYINNPMGRKNQVYSNRQVFYKLYKEKLDKILVREAGNIKYELFLDRKKGEYYIYLKIPSEVIKKFYYDVVIKFFTDDPKAKNSSTIKNYDVQFYSNDPAFVFTFAHAMKKNKLFINDLKDVMSKKALKEVAKERNAKEEIGYVKSIYFAYLTIVRYALFDKISFTSYAKEFNKKELIKKIMPADLKVELRQNAQKEIKKPKKEIKRTSLRKINNNFENNNVNRHSNMKITKMAPMAKKIKKSKFVKKV